MLDAFKRSTIMAALFVALWRGRRRKKNADLRGTHGCRSGLNKYLPIPGLCVIGEGRLDEAPMLKIGEAFGPKTGPLSVKIGADVIDGTDAVAADIPGGISVLIGALEGEGTLMATEHEGYMWHFVLSPPIMQAWQHCLLNGVPEGIEELRGFRPELSPFEQPLEVVMRFAAWATGKKLSRLCVGMLNRPCNDSYYEELQRLGIQCTCPQGGSVALALNTQDHNHKLDIMLGRAGSPEAVMAAVCVRVGRGGGWFKWFLETSPEERSCIIEAGFDPDKVYSAEDLASGHVFISISSITGTDSLPEVVYQPHSGLTQVTTFFGRSRTGTFGIEATNHTDEELADPCEDISED